MPVSRYEKVEQCPYEKSHLITPDKLITHLTKCRKQHLKKYLIPNIVICPYKSTHHVPLTEFDYHVKNCDGKDLTAHFLLEKTNSNVKKQEPLPTRQKEMVANLNTIPEEEDWETQQIRAPYDPAKRILDKEVMRKPVGLTKSERKEFYVKERERRRFLAERNQPRGSPNSCCSEGEFTSNFVSSHGSTSQKFLYNPVSNVENENALEQMGMLRRPKLVATPTRAIYSPMVTKNEDTENALQPPRRLRRPHCVMTPTKNLENVANLEETGEHTEAVDHYDKYVAEKMKQMNI